MASCAVAALHILALGALPLATARRSKFGPQWPGMVDPATGSKPLHHHVSAGAREVEVAADQLLEDLLPASQVPEPAATPSTSNASSPSKELVFVSDSDTDRFVSRLSEKIYFIRYTLFGLLGIFISIGCAKLLMFVHSSTFAAEPKHSIKADWTSDWLTSSKLDALQSGAS